MSDKKGAWAEQGLPKGEDPEAVCRFLIEGEEEGRRVDVFLTEALPDFSRSRIQALLKKGDIVVSGRPVKAGHRLQEGEEVFCRIPPPAHLQILPQPMDLAVVYEDDDLIVINKPQGLVVHPAPGSREATLVHGLLAHCRDLSGINGVLRPGIVHRLDKDTSGLLVAAKNDYAHHSLAEQIQSRTMKRQYLALVWGNIAEPAGIVDAPIGRDPKDRQKMAVVAGGKPAQTAYRVLDRLGDQAVVLCNLLTGRTHQIRVHLRYLGYPIVGDAKYGRRKDEQPWSGQALHAWHLSFIHPRQDRAMVFFAGPPAEFRQALQDKRAEATLALLERETAVPRTSAE